MIPQKTPAATTLWEGAEVLSPEQRITDTVRKLHQLSVAARFPGRVGLMHDTIRELSSLWFRYRNGELAWTVDGKEVASE